MKLKLPLLCFFLWAFLVPLSSEAIEAAPPTFNKDVAPIIFQNCSVCHRPGEVAPFSLLNFRDVSKRSRQIVKVTQQRIMPPWKAEPGFGEFANDRHLTSTQLDTLKKWASAGSPEGAPANLPPVPHFTEGWTLGQPDLVLEPDESYSLAAEGGDLYRCFVVPTHLTKDYYVSAIEVRPGNRKVVHHVIAYIDTTGKARELDAKDPGPGYTAFGGVGFKSDGIIGGWAPGNYPILLPDGIGRFLPKNADLVLQVHYHRSGKAETDRTKIALYFCKTPVDKKIRSFPLAKRALRIQAGDSNYTVSASIPIIANLTLYRVTPHMHLLGRQMKVTATLPDGTLVPLVDVKDWDFNWQTSYDFKQPIHLPIGSRVDMAAAYDNSTNNAVNPNDPPRLVHWGEQTTDEMCIAFLSFTLDREHMTKGISVPYLGMKRNSEDENTSRP